MSHGLATRVEQVVQGLRQGSLQEGDARLHLEDLFGSLQQWHEKVLEFPADSPAAYVFNATLEALQQMGQAVQVLDQGLDGCADVALDLAYQAHEDLLSIHRHASSLVEQMIDDQEQVEQSACQLVSLQESGPPDSVRGPVPRNTGPDPDG